jgi:hypothetical protein
MRVVAVGGSASVGKTTCAAAVAERLGVDTVVHVDDLSKRIQASGEPHVLDTFDRPWQQPPEYLAHLLIKWTVRRHPAIVAAAQALAVTGGVIESQGIDARIASDLRRVGVTSVYVIETSPARLRATFEIRPSGSRFQALTGAKQDTVIDMNRLYAEWLRQAAAQADQPCVTAQPWLTLPDRILAACHGRPTRNE